MKLAIMQPYLFPYIGYWQLIKSVDMFVIWNDVNYIKKGYINRNSILVNGEAHRFTVELREASQNRHINEIEIGNNREKILKTIELAYKNASNYESIFPLIQSILEYPEKNLAGFIGHSLAEMSKFLEIDTQLIDSTTIEKNHTLKAEDLILDICERLNATHYINAIGGQELYNKAKFSAHGIRLNFIQSEIVEYRQFKNEFVPRLSIIDILMFNSKEKVQDMLERYRLV
jgi:hypothetical protein